MEVNKEDFLSLHSQISKLEEKMSTQDDVIEKLKNEVDILKTNSDRLSSNNIALKQEIDEMKNKDKDTYFG